MPDGSHRKDTPTSGWRRRLRPLIARLRGGYARRAITLLLLITALDFADRTLLSSLGPTFEHVYHTGNTEFGFLASAFAYVSAAATIPVGMLADRVNRTRLLALSLVLWLVVLLPGHRHVRRHLRDLLVRCLAERHRPPLLGHRRWCPRGRAGYRLDRGCAAAARASQ